MQWATEVCETKVRYMNHPIVFTLALMSLLFVTLYLCTLFRHRIMTLPIYIICNAKFIVLHPY